MKRIKITKHKDPIPDPQIHRKHIGEIDRTKFDKNAIDPTEADKLKREQFNNWVENANLEQLVAHQIREKNLIKDKTKRKSLTRKMSDMHQQIKNSKKPFSDHYEKHAVKYKRAQKTLIPVILGCSFIVMILELFYNYVMFSKTFIAIEPGLSKFYYSWALLTYIFYFIGYILFYTEREFFYTRPYLFWFIAFASLVLMITSFVMEAVAVSEIKEEPKRKAAQIPVVIDMVFGIILCILSLYFSYTMYDCHYRGNPVTCLTVEFFHV